MRLVERRIGLLFACFLVAFLVIVSRALWLQGVQGALEVIEQAKEFYNPDLEWLGVVMNIADMRTVHSRDSYTALREHFGDRVFTTVIRASIAYAESAEKALSILDYRPDLGVDYLHLADEVLARVDLQAARRRLKKLIADLAPTPAA